MRYSTLFLIDCSKILCAVSYFNKGGEGEGEGSAFDWNTISRFDLLASINKSTNNTPFMHSCACPMLIKEGVVYTSNKGELHV